MSKFRMNKLANGIRVVSVPLKGFNSVTIQAFFKIGAKYEEPGEFGLSHFLEHMAFKGTNKRPRPEDINKEIDSKGADYNADTGLEMTTYYLTTVRDNLKWAAELLADILFNSIYDSDEVKKERGVIIEEIRMYNDNPMMGLSGDFAKFFYSPTTKGCWDVTGMVSDIEGVDRKKIVSFREKYLNLNDMVVVIAGDIKDGDDMVVKEYFEMFENRSNIPNYNINLQISTQNVDHMKKKIEQGHFCLGLPTVSSRDKQKYVMKVLDIILDGNSSSRLFSKIREERGWAYYVYSISEMIKEGGFWGVQSGVTLEKLDEAITLVDNEVSGLKETLNAEELTRAKDYVVGKLKLASDRSEYWARMAGSRLLLLNEEYDMDKEVALYKKVSLEDLKNFA
ncbi:MAG TPA: pitrilysin family protein, partial [Patescibacteria group bacterium]